MPRGSAKGSCASSQRGQVERVDLDSLPEHVVVLEVGLRVALLGVNEVGELGGVANLARSSQFRSSIPVEVVYARRTREIGRAHV
mgnify:CR=1 FL=1